MAFQLKTSYFEGPLELLLSLIEDKKLHVSEISLAEVTEDYLNYVNNLSEDSEDSEIKKAFFQDRSQFVVVAATLILIKARSLLPTMELSEEESESIDDLTERLRLYEIIKRYGELLAKTIGNTPAMYRGNPPKAEKKVEFTPHESLTTKLLTDVLGELFAALPVIEKLQEKSVKTTITLEQVMERVQTALQSGALFSLRDATDQYKNANTPTEKREAKVFAVLSFLAVLEMVKKAQVMVVQSGTFDDIVVSNYQANHSQNV
jgi:segregation and condensation protein A